MTKLNQLRIFTLYSLDKKLKRQVAIDPRKVTALRKTVHGSVVIHYPGKTSYEVAEDFSKVVRQINEARI